MLLENVCENDTPMLKYGEKAYGQPGFVIPRNQEKASGLIDSPQRQGTWWRFVMGPQCWSTVRRHIGSLDLLYRGTKRRHLGWLTVPNAEGTWWRFVMGPQYWSTVRRYMDSPYYNSYVHIERFSTMMCWDYSTQLRIFDVGCVDNIPPQLRIFRRWVVLSFVPPQLRKMFLK